MSPRQIDRLQPGAYVCGPSSTVPRRVLSVHRRTESPRVQAISLRKRAAGLGWKVPDTVYLRSDLYPDAWRVLTVRRRK